MTYVSLDLHHRQRRPLSHQQYARSSKLARWPFKTPLASTCLVSSTHPRSQSFQSTSLDIFLKIIPSNRDIFIQQGLTQSSLFYLLRGIRKNPKYLNHYRHDCIYHFFIWWHRDVDFETSKKCFYAFKYFNQSLLACTSIFSCL